MTQPTIFTGYLEILKKREPSNNAKTRIQELVTPYLEFFNWREKSFFQDMTAFWITINEFLKNHSEADLFKRLDWCKAKDLYCLQVLKVLNK